MTEKRFTLLVDGDEIYCTDNQGYGFNYPMYDVPSAKDMIKLLNKLSDENEQLKQQVAFLEEFIKTGVQYEYYQKIYEDNEQLKARIQLLSTLLDIADTIIDLSDDEKAKAFWEKRNRETEQEWEKILSDDEK